MDTTVIKGISVLELLARAEAPMRLSAIAQQLDLQKSNVHRLLSTLGEMGYVEQEEETGRYKATLKLWELGAGLIAGHPAKRAAAPFMQEVHRATSETVSLTILDGTDVLYLDKILSPRPLRFTTQPGSRAPAPMTASGRAMLAYEPDADDIIKKVIKSEPRAKGLDVGKLQKELAQIRARGYATSESSWTPGVVSVAAPIMARDGRAAAGLVVSGPSQRLTAEARLAAAESLMHACARIAETYGGV